MTNLEWWHRKKIWWANEILIVCFMNQTERYKPWTTRLWQLGLDICKRHHAYAFKGIFCQYYKIQILFILVISVYAHNLLWTNELGRSRYGVRYFIATEISNTLTENWERLLASKVIPRKRITTYTFEHFVSIKKLKLDLLLTFENSISS